MCSRPCETSAGRPTGSWSSRTAAAAPTTSASSSSVSSARSRRPPDREITEYDSRRILLGDSGRAGLLFRLLLGHPFAEAERAHVGPDLADVREALGLRSGLPGRAPAARDLAVG